MRTGIFAQILLSFLALFALAGAGTYWLASAQIARHVHEQTGAELRQRLALLARRFESAPPTQRSPNLQAEVRALGSDLEARLTLIAPDGTVLADSGKDPAATDDHSHRPEVLDALRDDDGSSLRRSDTLSLPMLYVARRLGTREAPKLILRAARPLADIQRRQDELLQSLLLAEAIVALGTLLVAGALARRISRPLADLTETAVAIAAGEGNRRVKHQGGKETARLARAFNSMADRVQQDLAVIRHDRMELLAILSGMVEGVLALDADQRVLWLNDAAAAAFDVDARTSRGQPLHNVVRLPALQELVAEALRTDRAGACETHLVAGGRERVVLLNASPLLEPGEPSRGVVILARDVTEARRIERTRRDFVANASHELKTPLAAIRGLAETILQDEEIAPDTARAFVQRILAQSERLSQLVREMLALSRAEAGSDAPSPVATELGAAVWHGLDTYAPLAQARTVALHYDAPDAPLHVRASQEALERIVGNLLDNAVKYSPPSGRVQVRLVAEGVLARLSVRDEGPGIAAEYHDRVFERFFRVDESRSREAGGTGLGLAIVKHLAVALGGRVGVESAPGRGSEFSVWIPLVAAPTP